MGIRKKIRNKKRVRKAKRNSPEKGGVPLYILTSKGDVEKLRDEIDIPLYVVARGYERSDDEGGRMFLRRVCRIQSNTRFYASSKAETPSNPILVL